MDNIAKHRDLIKKLFEQEEEDLPNPPSRAEIKKQQRQRDTISAIYSDWKNRQPPKNLPIGKYIRGIYHSRFGWTIARSTPDEAGEHQEIDIMVYVSGEPEEEMDYSGDRHTSWSVSLDWAEVDSPDPNEPALTLKEKVALQLEFDAVNSSLYDHAVQSLFDELNDRYRSERQF
jgi:hypothetical protein